MLLKQMFNKKRKDFLKVFFGLYQLCCPSEKDTDYRATIQAIQDDISFQRCHCLDIDLFNFLASIGLNANSTPVVIGAMLIAPSWVLFLVSGSLWLINDLATLRRSLVNFGVMVLLSVLTAFLFRSFSASRGVQ